MKMKISKIAKLCKDTKLVCMTSTEAGLWIGNGSAVYFVPEFTNMDCDGIALAFGIDEKKKEKNHFYQPGYERIQYAGHRPVRKPVRADGH